MGCSLAGGKMASSNIILTKGTVPTNPVTNKKSLWLDSSDDKFKTLNTSGTTANIENVQSDWNASSGDAQILNKPTIPDIAPLEEDIATIELQNIEAHGSGLVSGGQLVPTGGNTFSIYPYIGYVSDNATYDIRVASSVAITGLTTEFPGTNVVTINTDNEVEIFDNPNVGTGRIILGVAYTVLNNTQIVEILSTPIYCSDIAGRFGRFSLYATGPLIVSGCTLAEGTTDLTLSAASGVVSIAGDNKTFDATTTFTKFHLTADYGWVAVTSDPDELTPGYYNDTTQNYGSAIVAVTPTYWTKSLVFRTPSGLMYFIFGKEEYATEDEAKAAPIPSMPDFLASVAVYLAVIVAQAEDTSIGLRIQDVRPYLPRVFGYGSTSAGVSLAHSSLTGLLNDDHPQYLTEARAGALYALITSGVTNGDTHNHSGGDGGQIGHTTLSDIGTNTHAAIDTFIANRPFETNTANIKMNGTVSAGVLNAVPRSDHTHATDTSREPAIVSEVDFTNALASSITTPASGKTNIFIESTTPKNRLSTKDSSGTIINYSGINTSDSLTNKTLYTQAVGLQSVATTGGTTTLTVSSPVHTIFTGTSSQTLKLPNATTLSIGWMYKISNNSTQTITIVNNSSTAVSYAHPGITMIITCMTVSTTDGTWKEDAMAGADTGVVGALICNDSTGNMMYGSTPNLMSSIHLYGHSYFDMPWGIGASPWISANQNNGQGNQFSSIIGGSLNKNIFNHAVVSSLLTTQGRAHGGFCTAISQIQKATTNQVAPYVKQNNGTAILCWGINDIGLTSAGNQSAMRTSFSNCLNSIISRLRASAIFPANTGRTGWTFGANFTNSTATNLDWNSGQSVVATVVDSAGSSTATFTIPAQYKGEPICFLLIGNNTGSSCVVTWGGTVTNTTGIVGLTTQIHNSTISAHGLIPIRFTNAANGLSSANACQTITVRITTVSGGTFELDSAWIESFKPNGVLVCNVPRPLCKNITIAGGDGVTTSGSTAFSSAKFGFVNGAATSYTDVGCSIASTSPAGAIQSDTVVSSVGSATNLTMSKTATSSSSNVQFTINRQYNGYVSSGYTNTNFTSATVANHTSADADVAALNTSILNVVNSWDGMVKLVDLESSMGNDSNLPSSIYSWFNSDSLHLNDYGNAKLAQLCIQAINSLQSPTQDDVNVGLVENLSGGISCPGTDRRIIYSGGVYGPQYSSFNATAYTCVLGNMFALPLYITEPTSVLTTFYVEQTNAPTTSGSSIRLALYNDINNSGYPQNLVTSFTGSAFALGTTAGMKTVASGQFWPLRPGLWWLVMKVDVLGTTASQLRAVNGPNRYMPHWLTTGGANGPIAWRLTSIAAGAFPNIFASGATLVATAPMVGVAITTI